MANSKVLNPCTRCGKQRKVSKVWTETGDSIGYMNKVVHYETECPDSDCQVIVLQKIEDFRRKKMDIINSKVRR